METLERLRAANFWVAVVLGCIGTVTVVTTFLPGAPYVPQAVEVTSFVLTFPVFGAALVRDLVPAGRALRVDGGRARSRASGGEMLRVFDDVPAAVKAAVGVLFVAMWLAALSGILGGPGGQPSESDGRYYLNDHGEVTEITRDEYEHAVATSTRGFAAVPTAFYALAAMVSWYGPLDGRVESDETGA